MISFSVLPYRKTGLVVSFLAWTITLFTLGQMVYLHEYDYTVRYKQYHLLAKKAFGAKGFWIVLALQVLAEVSLDIVFMVIAGISMQYAYYLTSGYHTTSVLLWIAVFASIQVFFAILTTTGRMTKFQDLKPIVLLAAAMSIG